MNVVVDTNVLVSGCFAVFPIRRYCSDGFFGRYQPLP